MIKDLEKAVTLLQEDEVHEAVDVIQEAIRDFDSGYLLRALGCCSRAVEMLENLEQQTPRTVAARELVFDVFVNTF